MIPKEDLRHRIMYAVCNILSKSEDISRYDALEEVAHNIYFFSKAKIYCGAFKTDYRFRFAKFVVLGDEDSLSESELELASLYFGDNPFKLRYPQKAFDIYANTLKVHKEWLEKLETATENTRKTLKSMHIDEIISRIKDYLNYIDEFVDDNGEMCRYLCLYQIGYADGKRAERQKKKAKTALESIAEEPKAKETA